MDSDGFTSPSTLSKSQFAHVPPQAIQAMKDIDDLKKKFGEITTKNTYQPLNALNPLRRQRKQSHGLSQVVAGGDTINSSKKALNLNKSASSSMLSLSQTYEEPQNPRAIPPTLFNAHYKINASSFNSKKYSEITKQTMGIDSLMIRDPKDTVRFPPLTKSKLDKSEVMEGFLEKSMKNRLHADDLLQNMSLITAKPTSLLQESVSYSQFLQPSSEQSSMFADEKNIAIKSSRLAAQAKGVGVGGDISAAMMVASSPLSLNLRKSQSKKSFNTSLSNQQLNKKKPSTLSKQQQPQSILGRVLPAELIKREGEFDADSEDVLSSNSLQHPPIHVNFEGDISKIHSLHLKSPDRLINYQQSQSKKASIYSSPQNNNSVSHLLFLQGDEVLGDQNLNSSHHLSQQQQQLIDPFVQSVDDTLIVDNSTHANYFNQMPNETFEDYFDETMIAFDGDKSSGTIRKNGSTEGEGIRIRNRNNFRIEPLDEYDEYSLRDVDFTTMLTAGPQQAMSRWQHINGRTYWKNCLVTDFDKEKKLFTIQWTNARKVMEKKVRRLNLMFYFDDPDLFKKRYQAAIKKREEFLFNQGLTEHIDNKQGSEMINLPLDRISRTVDRIFAKRPSETMSEESSTEAESGEGQERGGVWDKKAVLEEVVSLYRFQLVKFSTEYEQIDRDVFKYYEKYLPSMSAAKFVSKMPIKDCTHFESYECENGVVSRIVVTAKPHLCPNAIQHLTLFRWIHFQNKKALNANEIACLSISQVMLGFIQLIQNLNFFKEFNRRKKIINANEKKKVEAEYVEVFNRAINQVDRLAYKVEKGIDEMRLDFPQQISSDAAKLLFSISNNLILNSMETAFQISVNGLVGEIEGYYAVLPMPEIDLKLIRRLPESLYVKRRDMRSKLMIESDLAVEERNISEFTSFVQGIEQQLIQKKRNMSFISSRRSSAATAFLTQEQNPASPNNAAALAAAVAAIPVGPTVVGTAAVSSAVTPAMNRSNLRESYSAIIFNSYKSLAIMDRSIMNSVAHALQHQFLEHSCPTVSINSLESSILKQLPCFPKFEIDWVFNKDYKIKRMNAEQRKLQKAKYRSVIYTQNDSQEIVLAKQNRAPIRQSVREENKTPRKERLLSEDLKDDSSSQRGPTTPSIQNQQAQSQPTLQIPIIQSRFEFVRLELLSTTTSPSPSDLEELFKAQFFKPIDRILNIFEIGKMETTKYQSKQLTQDTERAKQAINEIIPSSFYGIYSFLILLNSLSFLFNQKKHFIADIQADADKSGGELAVYCDEINELERDLMFFRVGLPNYLNFGLVALRLETLKAEFINQINTYISELKQILVQKFVNKLTGTENRVDSLSAKMKKVPSTLQEFVDCSDFFSSSEIVETYSDIQQQIHALRDLMFIMDEYSLNITSETTETFVQSGSWILRLRSLEEESRAKLNASRPRFEKVLAEKIRDLTRRFEAHSVLQQQLREEGTASLSNVFSLSNQTKSLKVEIDEIYGVSQELNRYEDYLQIYPISDFAEIRDSLNDLMKYYDLWDFAERWKLLQEEWSTRPLVYIESKDVVDTINEGLQLLPDLMRDFTSLPSYVAIIQELEAELSQFNSYTHILIQLRDNCFKPRHWEELIDEIYLRKEQSMHLISVSLIPEAKLPTNTNIAVPAATTTSANNMNMSSAGAANASQANEKRIDYTSITLKRLIDENILSYSSFINRLYHVAMEDSAIEIELSKIEGLLKETTLKTLPYFVDFSVEFSFLTIKNIKGILANFTEARIRAKALITNKSFVEVFRKRMYAVSKLARVGKKVMKRIGALQNIVLSYAPLMIVDTAYDTMKSQERMFTKELVNQLRKLIDEFNVHIDALTYSGYNAFMLFSESESQEKSFPQSEEFRRRIGETTKLSEKVGQNVKKVLTKMRIINSRLYFLSDESLIDVIRLCNPNTNPQIVLNKMILPLFKGISSVRVLTEIADHMTKIDSETFKLSAYSNQVSVLAILNESGGDCHAFEFVFEKRINVDWSHGVEAALEASSRVEKEIRTAIKKQFVKNSPGINRLGYDYSEALRLVAQSQAQASAAASAASAGSAAATASELLFQVLYLNLDVCFYHDLTAAMLTCEEHDEMPESILTDFLTQMRFHLHHFILHSTSSPSSKSYLFSKSDMLKFSGLVMQSLKHQNVLQRFIEQRVDTLASFEYLALPKFTLEIDSNAICRALHQIAKAKSPDIPPADIPMPFLNQREIIKSIAANTKRALDARESTEFPNLADTSPFFQNASLVDNMDYVNINLIAMNYKRGYTWEILGGEQYSFVNTGQTEKMIFNVISAISTNTGVLLRGPAACGKASTIAMLSSILAKPYFMWRFSNANDFASLNSVLVGTAQGGYVTHIANCEALSVAMISTFANIVFAIRSSALNRDDSLSYAGNTIKVSEHWGLYASFTVKEDERMVQFSELPNILESFRTVSLVTPDIQAILLSKFTLMNFVNAMDSAQRFAMFIQLLTTGFAPISYSPEANDESQNKVGGYSSARQGTATAATDASLVQQQQQQHWVNPSLRTIIKILAFCEFFLHEKRVQNDDLQDNFTLLHSAVRCFYANTLSPANLRILQDIFQQVFPEWTYCEGYTLKDFMSDSLNGSEAEIQVKKLGTPAMSPRAQSQGSKVFDDNLLLDGIDDLDQCIQGYFQKKHRVRPNESFTRKVEDIAQTIKIGKPIILTGSSQVVKNHAIDAAAYSLARVMNDSFDKHYITLDANDWSHFMGEFSSELVWRKGMMQQLLEMIRHVTEMPAYSECQKEYLNSTIAYFNTQPANSDNFNDTVNNSNNKRSGQNSTGNASGVAAGVTTAANGVAVCNPQSIANANSGGAPYLKNLKDWIIFETSASNFKGESGKRCEMMVKSLESGKFYFDNGELISMERYATAVLNVESLSSITPGTLSSFTLFDFSYDYGSNPAGGNSNNNASMQFGIMGGGDDHSKNLTSQYGVHWSIQQEFESWLDGLVALNPFFSLCERTLRTCYIYLLEPAITYLRDSEINKKGSNNNFNSSESFWNAGIVATTLAQQQRNFLSILEIFLNEFRKTMIATGKFAITSSSNTMKDAKSKAFYTLISLKNRKKKEQAAAEKSKKIEEEMSQGKQNKQEQIQEQQEGIEESTAALNTDSAWLDRQFRGPLESIFMFSLIQGLASSYLAPKYLNDFTEFMMQSAKRLQSVHLQIYDESFKACQNFRKILKQNKEMTVLDVVYDMDIMKWGRMAEFEVKDETPFLDSSLVNDHLEASEIIRLNKSALEIDELRAFVENEIKVAFTVPLEQLRKAQKLLNTASSASFKLVKFMMHYLMGYRRNVFVFSAMQAGKTTLTNHLESLHLRRNEIRMVRIPVGQATSIGKFQWLVENNLTFKNAHTKASEIGKFSYFCVEDLHLAPLQENGPNLVGCLRSLLSHSGWFSQAKNRFLKFENSHLLCNYSTNQPDHLKQLERFSGCLKDMFFIRFPEMNEMHLSSIFMGMMQSSSFFDSQEKIAKNLPAAERLQTVLVRFAHFFTNSFAKFQEIRQVYKINFSIEKVINIVQKLLEQQSLIDQSTGNLNIEVLSRVWDELFELSFANHLPWHSQTTDSQIGKEIGAFLDIEETMLFTSPRTQRIDYDKIPLSSARYSDLPMESFFVDQVYSPSITGQGVATTLKVNASSNSSRESRRVSHSIPRASTTQEMVGEMELKYFKLSSAELFDLRAKFLNQNFRRETSLSVRLAKQLSKLSLLNFKDFPVLISKLFRKAILSELHLSPSQVPPKKSDQNSNINNKSNNSLKVLVPQRIFAVSRSQSKLAQIMRDQFIQSATILPSSVSMKVLEQVNSSDGILQEFGRAEQRKLSTQLLLVDSLEFTAFIQSEFVEYVLSGGEGKANQANFSALWSIENQLGGIENIVGDIRAIINAIYHGEMHVSLYSSQCQKELLAFVAWLMGSKRDSISLGATGSFEILMESILEVMKEIAEGQIVHKVIHVKVEDLKGKEFQKLCDLLLAVKSIILTESLQGVFAEKKLKQIIEPWKAAQNKRLTSQAHVSSSSNSVQQGTVEELAGATAAAAAAAAIAGNANKSSVSIGEIRGNLIDNHLIRLMSGILRHSITFVVEVRLENYAEYQQIKSSMLKTFAVFCDYFVLARKSPENENRDIPAAQSGQSQHKKSDFEDKGILLNPSASSGCKQATLEKLFAAEREIHALFERTHFQHAHQSKTEIAFYAKFLSDSLFAHITKTVEKRYATMKRSTANLISTIEVKQPINMKLKSLLEELLQYKQSHIHAKNSLETVTKKQEERLRTINLIQETKRTYEIAFQNFRQINLVLGSLLKSIHYYRNECHPVLTFSEQELKQYCHLTALFVLIALKYPSTYREKLLEILAIENKKLLSLPFYKILGESPTSYLNSLIGGNSFGIPLVNEIALIETIISLDFLPLYITDETGLFLEWLNQKKKKNIVIEHSTIDEESESRIESCVSEGHFLVLLNPDQLLIDAVMPLLSQQHVSLMRQMINPNQSLGNPKKPDAAAASTTQSPNPNKCELFGKPITVHTSFRVIILSSQVSPFLSRILQGSVIAVNLSLEEKQAFSGQVYEEILEKFHASEKHTAVRQLIQRVDVLAKQDYSATKLLPLINSIELLDDSSWEELGFMLPAAVIHASMENGEIERTDKKKKKRKHSGSGQKSSGRQQYSQIDEDDEVQDEEENEGKYGGNPKQTLKEKKQQELEKHEQDQLEFKQMMVLKFDEDDTIQSGNRTNRQGSIGITPAAAGGSIAIGDAEVVGTPSLAKTTSSRIQQNKISRDLEVFGDLELHTQIGEQLQVLKREDAEEESKKAQIKSNTITMAGQMNLMSALQQSQESSLQVQPQQQERIRSRGITLIAAAALAPVISEHTNEASKNNLIKVDGFTMNNQAVDSIDKESTFAFNFEIIDFQANSGLSPNYPIAELNELAEAYKGLVEVVYGIRMSYAEVAKEIEKDDGAIRYSEENLILVFRQVAENMKANFDDDEESELAMKRRLTFAKDFASAYYHHLYCSLREDHQAIWMLALAYYFEAAAHFKKRDVVAQMLQREILINSKISQSQQVVFSRLTSQRQFDSFGVALAQLFGSFENLVAPLQNRTNQSQGMLKPKHIARLKDRLRSIRMQASARKKVPRLQFNSNGGAFTKQDEILQYTDKDVPFWQNTIKEDSEGSPHDDEEFNAEVFADSLQKDSGALPTPQEVSSQKDIENAELAGESVVVAAATILNKNTTLGISGEESKGDVVSDEGLLAIPLEKVDEKEVVSPRKEKENEKREEETSEEAAAILVNEDDFNSPRQNSKQKAALRQMNPEEFELKFGAQSNHFEDHIIDLPMIRTTDHTGKDFMHKIQEEFSQTQSTTSQHQQVLLNTNNQPNNQKKSPPLKFEHESQQVDYVVEQNVLHDDPSSALCASRRKAILYSVDAKNSNVLQPWVSENAYEALQHAAAVIKCPKLTKILSNILIAKEEWTKFMQSSHCEVFEESNEFWNVLLAQQASHENLGIVLKFIRPDVLERFLSTAIVKPLSRYFFSNSKWYRRATIIFYGTLNKSITELLELKASRGSSQVKRVALGSIGNARVKEILNVACEKGEWVVLENIKHVRSHEISGLVKIISHALDSPRAHTNFRVWITYQQLSGSYEVASNNENYNNNNNESNGIATSAGASNTSSSSAAAAAQILSGFLRSCYRMFLNRPTSIKAQLTVLYTLAIHEHVAQVEKKVLKAVQMMSGGGIGAGNAAITGGAATAVIAGANNNRSLQQNSTDDAMKYRVKVQKRSTNLVSAFNLHTVFIDRERLKETNKATISLLTRMSDKIKFNLFFAFALLRMRHRYHATLSKNYLRNDIIFFSDLDLMYIVEDGFQFLNTYTMSPSVFFRNYLTAIFAESTHYFGGSTWSITAMRDALEEIVFKGIDRQTVLTIGASKYSLFFEQPEQTTEHTIFSTISELPSVDPPAILDISHNTEVLYNQIRSERMMVRMHQELHESSRLKKAEAIKAISDRIEERIIDRDSMEPKEGTDNKPDECEMELWEQRVSPKQLRFVFTYWSKSIEAREKHGKLVSEIWTILEQFNAALWSNVTSFSEIDAKQLQQQTSFRKYERDHRLNSSDYTSSEDDDDDYDEDDYEEEQGNDYLKSDNIINNNNDDDDTLNAIRNKLKLKDPHNQSVSINSGGLDTLRGDDTDPISFRQSASSNSQTNLHTISAGGAITVGGDALQIQSKRTESISLIQSSKRVNSESVDDAKRQSRVQRKSKKASLSGGGGSMSSRHSKSMVDNRSSSRVLKSDEAVGVLGQQQQQSAAAAAAAAVAQQEEIEAKNMQVNLMRWLLDKPLQQQPNKSRKSVAPMQQSWKMLHSRESIGSKNGSPNISRQPSMRTSFKQLPQLTLFGAAGGLSNQRLPSISQLQLTNAASGGIGLNGRSSNVNGLTVEGTRRALSSLAEINVQTDSPMRSSKRITLSIGAAMGGAGGATSAASNSPQKRNSVYFGKPFALDQNSVAMNSPSLNGMVGASPLLMASSPLRNSMQLSTLKRKQSLVDSRMSIFNLNRIGEEQSHDYMREFKLAIAPTKSIKKPDELFSLSSVSQAVFESMVSHEFQYARTLVMQMMSDLNLIRQYESSVGASGGIGVEVDGVMAVSSHNADSSESVAAALRATLAHNRTPRAWWNLAWLSSGSSLSTFMRSLLEKLEWMETLSKKRNIQQQAAGFSPTGSEEAPRIMAILMCPVIPLNQLFDPFFLLAALLRARSKELNVSINDLVIECEVISKPVSHQPESGVHISGLFMRRAKLNANLALEADAASEFEYRLPNMKVVVKKKTYINNLYTTHCPSVCMAFKEDHLNDFEGVFYQQNQFVNGIKQQTKGENAGRKGAAQGDSKSLIVRIPVVNPTVNHLFNQFPLRIYFYFRSQRTQEFWVKRATEISLEQQFN